MNKLNRDFVVISLILCIIPAIWIAAWEKDILRKFENYAMDWRFNVRGELETPDGLKVIYVNFDGEAVNEFGERPWPRQDAATVAQALLELGKAKVVGFDIVYSAHYVSKLITANPILNAEIEKDAEELAIITATYPNIILATAYTEVGVQNEATMPLFYAEDSDHSKIEPPEQPASFTNSNHYQERQYAKSQMGLINVDTNLSAGATPRWVPYFTKHTDPFGVEDTFYQMSLQLLRHYYGLHPKQIIHLEDRIELHDNNGNILLSIPLWKQQMLEVNWYCSWENRVEMDFGFDEEANKFGIKKRTPPNRDTTEKTDIHTGFFDVFSATVSYVEGDEQEREAALEFFSHFENAIVLIGPTDPILQDIAPAPFDKTQKPKVAVHGNITKQVFEGLYIKHLPRWAKIAILIGLTILTALFGVQSGNCSTICKWVSGILMLGYSFIVFYWFSSFHIVIPFIAPLGCALTTTFTAAVYQLIREEKQKGRIKGMFQTYLAPELVNQMVESKEEPSLGGEKKAITQFFSDIQSFSAFSEKLSAEDLVDLMNEYLGAMTIILHSEKGSLDKYIGDAIVGMFGAPVDVEGHAFRGCVASQLMHKKQHELREKWKSEGDKWPDIVSQMQTRIGLNTGECTVGNMGSETRFNYTMMGDNVNLAARCESGAKYYGAYTMVTGETKTAAEEYNNERLIFRHLGKIVVKGRTQPVDVYEIVCLREDITLEMEKCLEIYNKGMKQYFIRQWDQAIAFFEEASKYEVHQPGRDQGIATNPSLTLISQCEEYKVDDPGPEWNGAYVMKSK